MGMYTELIFGASINTSKMTPQEIKVLKYLFSTDLDKPLDLPEHEFFRCSRWDCITSCSSYFFAVRNIHRKFFEDAISKTICCSSRANLKNYSREIEKFLDWIKPHIEQGSGEREFYAIVCYEEQSEPTIYYLKAKE